VEDECDHREIGGGEPYRLGQKLAALAPGIETILVDAIMIGVLPRDACC
jgi:hypothetical protein